MVPSVVFTGGVEIIKLAWVGTQTESDESSAAFFRDVLGLRPEIHEPGFWMFRMPDGSKVEVFGPNEGCRVGRGAGSGPVAAGG